MSRRLSEVTTKTVLDHGMFAIEDVIGEGFGGWSEGWVSAGRHSIWVQSPYGNLGAILRLEEWDGEPDHEPHDARGPWHDVVAVSMEYIGENETLSLNEIAAGGADTGFTLSSPGTYRVRVACRNGREARQAYLDILAKFDEADWNTAACRRATDQIDVEEEFLLQFWPADAA
ncbi:hypothetical protein [Jidongwangia harbinensis]|uniref:hypothetical protein n=1 Tax=Jidongwangia harbinensis TaxID=2878561 RepID=UPI001CD9BF3F|nr:hypothetical protein [Jidongwangia harbinensis]MCA2219492.1 hypothetical protein [Jidongwangia harbinensis]